ncbi:hypothetical protein [Chryseobacterium binzhouense]|uniref:hypothetical protein n=1 Tax=Chryseobacterium binzhouense TaxID=2593646 RepID=UPI001180AA58|nr:hypothetical protein [Chryseobacterium binzhouense]
MREENLNKLKSIFSDLKSEEQKLKESLEKKKTEEDLFLEEFKKLCKNIIDPKMQEFRRMLRENGFGCKISVNEENREGKGINSRAHIKLQISRNPDSNFYTNSKFPHIMFIGNIVSKRIEIHEDTIFQNGTGSAALKEQTYSIENLNEEITEQEILHSIENILMNK